MTEIKRGTGWHWYLTLGLQNASTANFTEQARKKTTYPIYQLHHKSFDVTWISVFEGCMPQTPKGCVSPLQHVVALEGTEHPQQQTFERFLLGSFTDYDRVNLPWQLNFGHWNYRFGKKKQQSTSFGFRGICCLRGFTNKSMNREKTLNRWTWLWFDKSETWVKIKPTEGMNEPQSKSKRLLIHLSIHRGLVGNEDKTRSKLGSCFIMSWQKCLNISTKW